MVTRRKKLLEKREAAVTAFRSLWATLQSEEQALAREWAEYEVTIAPAPEMLAQEIERQKHRLIALGLTERSFVDLDNTYETLRMIRDFADAKEAAATPAAEEFVADLDQLLSAPNHQNVSQPGHQKGTTMAKSIAAQLRRLEEKKEKALEAARREAARVEEAKKKLSEPLSKRFSGWAKNAIDTVLLSNLERLDDLSDTVTKEELEARVTEYLQAKLDESEKVAPENAAAGSAEIQNNTTGVHTEAASTTA